MLTYIWLRDILRGGKSKNLGSGDIQVWYVTHYNLNWQLISKGVRIC